MEAWATDDELRSAVQRFTAMIPGFSMPVAFGVARLDGDSVSLGRVNRVGAVRPLAAVVLASVCGYVDTTTNVLLSKDQLGEVIARLRPAEAATHIPHPNLWSWQTLLAEAKPDSTFHAYFLSDATDVLEGPGAEEFRAEALA